MDSCSQVDDVQSFVKAIGNNHILWKLLLKRQVTHFSMGTGIVSSVSHNILTINYLSFPLNDCKYEKKLFIKEFKNINPPILLDEIIELTNPEQLSKKLALLRSLKEHFEQDFLNAYNFYQTQCFKHILFDDYQAEKSNYVRSWVQRHLNPEKPPDLEQAAAIGAVEGHVQVVARAGSGKTSTLVNRALFLQKHCGIAPSEMLLLAFNPKAVEDIQKKLSKQLQGSMPM